MSVTVAQVEELIAAFGFPEVTVGERYGNRSWSVATKSFAWERPLTKADVKRWGTEAPVPQDPILAVAVEDMAGKVAVLHEGHAGFFDMQHFAGYPAYLIELRKATRRDVRAAIEDAWLAVAPKKLADQYLAK